MNTDRELYRVPPGDYYADSIHVTEGGGIGINCGGNVIVKPLREWFKLAAQFTTSAPSESATTILEDAVLYTAFPLEVLDALLAWSGHEPSTSELARATDKWDAELRALKAAIEKEPSTASAGGEKGDPDWAGLDWERLRSGDRRALFAEHQDVFDEVWRLRELSTQSASGENEAREGRTARMDRVIYHRLLTDLCSLILGSAVPIGPMRSRDDYPHELAKAVKFLHEIQERERNRPDRGDDG